MSKAKKKKQTADTRTQPQMKIVLSETCAQCRTPCARGLDYLARMRQPGAIGRGVPCVLTAFVKK